MTAALELRAPPDVLLATPLRDLGLTLSGTRLEPLLGELVRELEQAGIRRLRPRFYLSTEWGVPFGTVAIAIPFYLARDDLVALHAERTGHVEGTSPGDILRYLRHEMGHVLNYGYRLYEQPEWTQRFGPMDLPYREDYRPEPFSRRHVVHLPGWYAQKHPDEDWAETFAVWLTPGRDWRAEYAGWPAALDKLRYCDRAVRALGDQRPLVAAAELDEDVAALDYSLGQFYSRLDRPGAAGPAGIDGSLRTLFADLGSGATGADCPAVALLSALEGDLIANVYRWTGHFPEHTRPLLRHLARRADELGLRYPAAREREATVALTTLVTALAMSHVYRGSYTP